MQSSPSFKFYLLLIIAMITWGFAWPSGKAVAGLAHPNVIIFWRFLLTALSLIPIVILTGNSFQLRSKTLWLQVGIGGILYTIYNHFFLLGLELGMPGIGGVLVTTLNPLFTYLLVHLLKVALPSRREMFGLFLGLIGGCILLRLWDTSWSILLVSGNLFFLLGSFSWALLSMNSHSTGEKLSPLVYGFYVYTIGTLLDFFFAYPNEIFSVFQLDMNFWFHIVYLAIVSTTFGTTVYFFASTRLGSRNASSFIFLVPVTAVFSSWLFLDEIPAISTLIGGALAIGAVSMLNRKSEANPNKVEDSEA
ncbi:DMT family transporter [Leptospira sp. GIMC2001]|uniref:DMT family transporter n=1 Tax=Leptospira sp. GIMC2001 TaxID=1513297 RepID=UPI00234A6B64|nr:DMT family transporter [Leptospira sp. GIMC2001]WCL48768.1 DMT family transporter [Leptospira sp. GIMC2001]